ncbi:MAG: hypothetical protein JWO00_475 [Candidatus Parcubacteria bacterium]|nr:hypothetical protein [Candidatus Parcubacteria bacterium]
MGEKNRWKDGMKERVERSEEVACGKEEIYQGKNAAESTWG